MSPPNRYSQYENAFSRGNATSGEPICSGSTKFANPKRIGVAYSSSMIVPCMVNSWLYCSCDRNCCPGTASSVRISIAIAPPTMKKANEVTRYMMPICLWSVVRNNRRRYEPLTVSRAGNGRVAIGLGATAVTPCLQWWLFVLRRLGTTHGYYPPLHMRAREGSQPHPAWSGHLSRDHRVLPQA